MLHLKALVDQRDKKAEELQSQMTPEEITFLEKFMEHDNH